MKLFYWYCHYGPGHMGSDEGFSEWSNNTTVEDVIEAIRDRFDSYDWPIAYAWEVKKYPESYHTSAKQGAEASLRSAQKVLEQLEKIKTFTIDWEDGIDEDIKHALSSVIDYKLIEDFHKAGIIITIDEIGRMFRSYGDKQIHPPKKLKAKFLEIINKAEKYNNAGKK